MNSLFLRFYLKRELFSRYNYSILILLSISLGVGSVIGIHSYKENTASAIRREAKQIMGADLALQSPQEFTEEAKDLVRKRLPQAAKKSESIQFLSMISNGGLGENSLSFVKAIETNYPFYGEMVTEPKEAYKNLKSNQILLESNLIKNLKLKLGDTVRLGDFNFILSGEIIKEPGAVGSFVGSAPSSVINISSVEKTGLVQRGSRIRYTIYLKFPEGFDTTVWKDQNFEDFIKEDLTIYHNTEVNSGSQSFIKNTFDYMALLALCGFFLGAISIYTAVRTRLNEKKNEIAILMCLGAKPNTIFGLVLLEILSLSFIGTILGLCLGFWIQSILPDISGLSIEKGIFFGFSVSSFVWSLVLGVLLPAVISLPLVLETRTVKPLAALRELESDSESRIGILWQVFSFFVIYFLFFLLAFFETESFPKALVFSGVLFLLPVLVWILYLLLGLVLNQLVLLGFVTKEWSLVTKKITRKSGALRLSIIGLGSALFILILSLILQESLLELSGAREIERRPNMFLLDIRDSQKDGVLSIISKYPSEKQFTAPIIGARLAKVNGEPIRKEDTVKNAMDRNWRATARTREYFLSYRDHLYDTEKVTNGSWWNELGRDEISVERDFAGYLKAGVGDRLTFNVQGREITGKITNLRSVNWSDMKPNFVVLFSRGILENAPRFYITSLLIDDAGQRYQLQKQIVSEYPNITVIDTEKTVQAFMGILEKVVKMMSLMTLFILIAALILVFTSLYASQRERKKEFALLRVIGADSKFMLKHFTREATLVSTFAFLIGCIYAGISNEILNKLVLDLRSVYPMLQILFVFIGILSLSLLLYFISVMNFFRLPSKSILKEVKG